MTTFLLISLGLTVWVVSLYVHPFGACPRCRGQGRIMRGTKTRPRPVRCPRCKGARRRQRPGSRTVHQLVRRVERYHARQRAERARATTSKTRTEESQS